MGILQSIIVFDNMDFGDDIMKKIAVVGMGYVGLVTALIFADTGYYVNCIDTDKDKINLLKDQKVPFFEKNCEKLLKKNCKRLSFYSDYNNICDLDFFFVCVGTPLNPNNSFDLSYIMNSIEEIKNNTKLSKEICICIRSTILPETCKMLDSLIVDRKIKIIHNPEFLSQGNAIADFINASRIVIGLDDNIFKNKISSIYKKILKKYNKKIPILFMSREEAEMVKFVSNSYLAMRISFINDIANLCDIMKINISKVIDGVKYDNRIGKEYLKCGIGYGGSCLPKDTKAILDLSIKKGYKLNMIESTIRVNELQRAICLKKIKADIVDLSNKEVAILGVTFKSGTDDIRNSSSIFLIDSFLNKQSKVNVYDPRGLEKMRLIYNDKISYFTTIKECINNCDIIIVNTEWDEIKNFEFNKIKFEKRVYLYDFKNCLSAHNIENSNLKYWRVGGNYEL